LVVLAAALLVLLLYRFRMHQKITEMNVRSEERLAERARIAQDLHDTLLQGILSASMHLHVANNKLPDDSRQASRRPHHRLGSFQHRRSRF